MQIGNVRTVEPGIPNVENVESVFWEFSHRPQGQKSINPATIKSDRSV